MQISKHCVVTINIKIEDLDGNVLEDTFTKNQPVTYVHGVGQMMPGIEEGVVNQQAGYEFQLDIDAEKAFGLRREDGVKEVPKQMFEQVPDLKEGMVLRAQDQGQDMLFTVKKITDSTVTIDANHPLAGKAVKVKGAVVNVRELSDEEKNSGKINQ